MTAPRRHKTLEELTPDEHARRHDANHKGEPEPKFETDDYRDARAELLKRHGFDDNRDEENR